MIRVDLPLPIDSYQTQSSMFSSARCVNWIPTVSESDAFSRQYLAQPAGVSSIATLAGKFRGGISSGDFIYFVQDNTFNRLEADNSITVIGAISGANRTSIATNGRFIVIVSDLQSFVFDSTLNTVVQITNPNFITASSVAFKDGFFIYSTLDGTRFFNSNLNNPLVYDALDVGTAEIRPDPIVSVHVNRNELFVMGSETIEAFQNVGGAGFPFQRIPGANIQKGVYAKNSVIEFDNTFCFLGGGLNEQAAIWKAVSSSSVTKISTNAIDHQIQLQSDLDISEAFSMTFQLNGQFVLIFVIGTRVLCYNSTASQNLGRSIWFELDWTVSGILRRGVETIAHDTSDNIGVMDASLRYFDKQIRRELISQPFYGKDLPVFEGNFELIAETGLSLDNSDPIIRYSFSDDGGKTFSSEFQRTLGFKGAYEKRIVWRRQGRFPISRVIKLEISDDVECHLLGMSATAQSGFQ